MKTVALTHCEVSLVVTCWYYITSYYKYKRVTLILTFLLPRCPITKTLRGLCFSRYDHQKISSICHYQLIPPLFFGKPKLSYRSNLEAVFERCNVKKMFLKNSQNPQENICVRGSFLISFFAGLRPATLLKKCFRHRHFPVSFPKSISYNIYDSLFGRLQSVCLFPWLWDYKVFVCFLDFETYWALFHA